MLITEIDPSFTGMCGLCLNFTSLLLIFSQNLNLGCTAKAFGKYGLEYDQEHCIISHLL